MAIEDLADRVERLEADALRMAVLEDRDVGHRDPELLRELGQGDFALRHHDVEIDDDHTIASFSSLIAKAARM